MRAAAEHESFRKGGTLNDAGHHILNGCRACGEDFAGIRYFDEHRTGDNGVSRGPRRRRCLNPAEMMAKGWLLDNKARWHDPANAQRARDLHPQRGSGPLVARKKGLTGPS